MEERTASTMALMEPASASRISTVLTSTAFGRPVARSRPRISIVSSGSSGEAEPATLLDLFGRALADQQVMDLAGVGDDVLVHLVAGHADGGADDDAAERDDGDLGRPTADVDDHAAGGLHHRQAGADRGRHRLLDQVAAARAGVQGGIVDGALFDFGDAAGDADDHARLGAGSRGRAPRG